MKRLKNIFLLLVCLTFLTSCNSDRVTKIYVATDNHLLPYSINDKGPGFQKLMQRGNGNYVEYSEDINTAFLDKVYEDKPDILIMSGDLSFNGEKVSHNMLSKLFEKVESNGKTQVIVIPGNHDLENPWSRSFKGDHQEFEDKISAEEFQEIYDDFGFKQAISKDKNSRSYMYPIDEKVWILMLDSAIYENNSFMPIAEGELKEETIKWIEECGEKAKKEGKTLISSIHHNLIKHSSASNEMYVVKNSEEVLEAFKKADVKLNLSGHIHKQSIKKDEKTDIVEIVTSALIGYPVQYGIIELNNNNKSFTYNTHELNVSNWANKEDKQDSNLLDFDKYKKDYYYNFSKNQAYGRLYFENNEIGEANIELMSQVFGKLNLMYFKGELDKSFDEVKNSVGYKLWKDNPRAIMGEYVLSIEKNNNDNNFIKIDNFYK